MSSVKDGYLILYNILCCIGWTVVLFLSLPTIFSTCCLTSLQEALRSMYFIPGLSNTLTVVQLAAGLEIVHAALGIVRSPVFVTAVQVGSRLSALFFITFSPQAQGQVGAGIMILSWALVEVPRYAFYVTAVVSGDAAKKTPYLLFWLRYSLFAILYPTGITGELTVFLTASKDPIYLNLFGPSYTSFFYYLVMAFPAIYVPSALPMIFNMVGNRKNAFGKRFAKPPPPPRGLVWPIDPATGERTSTIVSKAIIAAAIGAVNPEKAKKVLYERNWRFGYVKHFITLVEEQMKSSDNALRVAEAGLAKAYELFEFVDPSTNINTSFQKAMTLSDGDIKDEDSFYTGFIQGTGKSSSKITLEVPYKGKKLSGQDLKDQVDRWVNYGTIEACAGNAIKSCVDHPQYLDLSDKYFVLLGAGSAMGPFLVLMALGANVIAIDLDRPNIWKRLISIARESSGSITFPMKVNPAQGLPSDEALFASAGCNLFTQTPSIRNWLMAVHPGKNITVGSYAYLDGALHVQVSLAMDAICKDMTEKRRANLAYLCTPTDIHVITKDAHVASLEMYQDYSRRIICYMMKVLSRGRLLRKNAMKPVVSDSGEVFYVVNGLSIAQGPNYALAKRMQHWRAIIARSKGGCIVSSNVAPATSTVSVVHNRTFAWAYEGMPYFKPYEIFSPETSNAVMSAILLSDLSDPESPANPKFSLKNPNELFKYRSFNGGAWRCAYQVDSIGEPSVYVYFGRLARPYVMTALIVGVAVWVRVVGYI